MALKLLLLSVIVAFQPLSFFKGAAFFCEFSA